MNITLIIPADDATIKSEVAKFSEEIAAREAEIGMLSKAIGHYQSLCKHPGQRTGHNERDGSWAAPCPICREAH